MAVSEDNLERLVNQGDATNHERCAMAAPIMPEESGQNGHGDAGLILHVRGRHQ